MAAAVRNPLDGGPLVLPRWSGGGASAPGSFRTIRISAPLTLTRLDRPGQYVDPGGLDLAVLLPSDARDGQSFTLRHNGAAGRLFVAAAVVFVAVLSPGDAAGLVWDATAAAWRVQATSRDWSGLRAADPYRFKGVAVSPQAIALWWRKPAAGTATGYLLQRSADAGVTWSNVASLDGLTDTYTDTGLTPATAYQYRVTSSGGLTQQVAATTPTDAATAGSPQNGTGVGSPTFAAGHFSNALVLNGTSQSAEFPLAAFSLPAGSLFTVECWFKTSAGGTQIIAICQGPAVSGNDNDWLLYTAGGALTGNVIGFGTLTSSGAAVNDNAYHHAALVVTNAGKTLTLYQDGVAVGTNTIGSAWVKLGTSNIAVVGRSAYSGGVLSPNAFFAGQVDELRVSTTARYTTGFTPAAAAFVNDASTLSLYHFNGDLTDSSHPGVRASQTWFLDPVNGSDANDGLTILTPVKTLTPVSVVRGDGVLFKGGTTYTGNVVVPSGGVVGRPVTYGSYGVGRAKISCGTGHGIVVGKMNCVQVVSLEVAGPGVNSVTGATTSTGIGIRVFSDATSGPKWVGIGLYNVDVHGTQQGITLETPYANGIVVVGYDQFTLDSFKIHNTQRFGFIPLGSGTLAPGGTPIGNTTHSNLTVRDGEIWDNTGVPDTVADGTYGCNVLINNCTTVLVERVLCRDSGAAGGFLTQIGGGQGGIIVQESDQVTIRRCEAARILLGNAPSDSCGFDFDGGVTNSLVEWCYAHDCDGAAYQHGVFPGSNPTTGNVFRYNVGVRCGGLGGAPLNIFGGDGAVFHHNFIDGATINRETVGIVVGSNPTAHKILNNVFLIRTGQAAINAAAGVNAAFDGNLWWRPDGVFAASWAGTSYSTYAAWKAATGQASHGGAVADPALASSAGPAGNPTPDVPLNVLPHWTPAAGSPALTAGVDVTALYGVAVPAADFMLRAAVGTAAGPVMPA